MKLAAKKTFYSMTSEEDENKAHVGMTELQKDLEKTRNMVRHQRVRYQKLVSNITERMREQEYNLQGEFEIKHSQLTQILRSLYVLDAKLRVEQRSLKSALQQQDDIIRDQEIEINKLKNKLKKLELIADYCNCNGVRMFFERSMQEDGTCDQMSNLFVSSVQENDKKWRENKPDLISSIGMNVIDDKPVNVSHLPAVDSGQQRKIDSERMDTAPVTEGHEDTLVESSNRIRVSLVEDSEKVKIDTIGVVDTFQDVEVSPSDNSDQKTYVIPSIDKYKPTLQVRKSDIDRDISSKTSPRRILEEVTTHPTEKLINSPVLKCVKDILSHDMNCSSPEISKKQYPFKPPKPSHLRPKAGKIRKKVTFETDVKSYRYETNLSVKPVEEDHFQSENEQVLVELLPMNDVSKPVTANPPEVEGSKIVQTVSALLTDCSESDGEANPDAPKVSQMVKKFEVLGSKSKCNGFTGASANECNSTNAELDYQTNFEEFHLLDTEIATTCDIVQDHQHRAEAEGEEKSAPTDAKYDVFLEMTGLSQKSILTPSRILSNHRSMMKPKDVKYRSRVKACGVLASPMTKYWSEPFI